MFTNRGTHSFQLHLIFAWFCRLNRCVCPIFVKYRSISWLRILDVEILRQFAVTYVKNPLIFQAIFPGGWDWRVISSSSWLSSLSRLSLSSSSSASSSSSFAVARTAKWNVSWHDHWIRLHSYTRLGNMHDLRRRNKSLEGFRTHRFFFSFPRRWLFKQSLASLIWFSSFLPSFDYLSREIINRENY